MSDRAKPASDQHLPSVLHVVPYYPPDRVGGVGEHVRVIHEGHVRRGVRSEVLTSGKTHSDPRVHRVGRSPNGFLLQVWRRVGLAMQFDVLHAHHGEGFMLLFLVRLRRRRPRILTMFHVDVRRRERASGPHTFDGERYGPSGAKNGLRRMAGLGKALLDQFAWMLADTVVVETDSVGNEVADLKPFREVLVVPHGLSGSSRSATKPEDVELLYVGTPGIRKRTHLLAAILYRVRQSVPEARLRIVGFDVNGDPRLRAEAERFGVLSAINFVGSVRSEEVVPFYRSADVLLLPSGYEGLPMVLLEAMREGLVPVATAVSGHPEAIDDGRNGYLVELDNVDAIVDRCVRLLEDPVLAAELGQHARETIFEKFSLAAELEAYLRIYSSLLDD